MDVLDFCCPLCKNLFTNPVVLNGYSYDAECLQKHWEKHGRKCPSTQQLIGEDGPIHAQTQNVVSILGVKLPLNLIAKKVAVELASLRNRFCEGDEEARILLVQQHPEIVSIKLSFRNWSQWILALHVAAVDNQIKLLETILDSKLCNVDILSGWETTTLQFAAQRGNLAMVKVLLAYGANPNHSSTVSTFGYAMESGSIGTISYLTKKVIGLKLTDKDVETLCLAPKYASLQFNTAVDCSKLSPLKNQQFIRYLILQCETANHTLNNRVGQPQSQAQSQSLKTRLT